MSKKTETELKFKLSKLPDSLKDHPYLIKQIYLKYDDQDLKNKISNLFLNVAIEWQNIAEVRIRAKVTRDDKLYFITLKTDGLLERDEYENILSEDQYNDFSRQPYIGAIVKFRYDVPILGTELIIEIDDYIGGLYGLQVAEIEFDQEKYTKEKIIEFAEKYLGEDIIDITADSKYKNKNLAKLNNIVENKSK